MTTVLWALQIGIAFFCVSGAVWRQSNFEQAAKDVASIGALPRPVWMAIGAFEVVSGLILAIGLVLPSVAAWVGTAATLLAIELFALTLLHLRHFGVIPKATNPATWTFVLGLLSGMVAAVQ